MGFSRHNPLRQFGFGIRRQVIKLWLHVQVWHLWLLIAGWISSAYFCLAGKYSDKDKPLQEFFVLDLATQKLKSLGVMTRPNALKEDKKNQLFFVKVGTRETTSPHRIVTW